MATIPKTYRSLAAFALLCAAATGYTPAASALTCTSVGTNNWNTIATWTSVGNCNRVPIAGDDVVIATGTTTLDVSSAALASLTVNGTLNVGNNATVRALNVTGNVTVGAGGTITVGATAAVHTFAIGGNLSNSGTVNFLPAAGRVVNVTFNRNGNQTVSGSGTYAFNLVTLNMGTSNTNVLEMLSTFTAPTPFLTITNGTYKHSTSSNISPFSTTAGATIPLNGGFWLNNAAATVTTTGADWTINGGYVRLTDGTMTIGAANTTRMVLGNFATTLLQVEAGTLTVTGGINSSVNTGAGTFTMSGGQINLSTISAGSVYVVLLGSATTLNWSGGLIVASKGNAAADDVDIRSATQNVTGGTLQMGSGASSGNQISLINSGGGTVTVWNLVLNQSQANNILLRSSLNVLNDLTINTLNTLLPNAGLAINVGDGDAPGGGNWINHGAFTQSTTVVSMIGTEPGTIDGTVATTFYQLVIDKSAASLQNRKVTLDVNASITNRLTLNNGYIDSNGFSTIIPANGTVVRGASCSTDGATNGCFVSGNLQKNFATGNQTRTFEVGSATPSLVAYSPLALTLSAVTTAGNVTVAAIGSEHPSLGSSGLDSTKSANRYWTIANSATVFTANATSSVTMSFVAADLDAGATPGNFNVGRFNGSTWTASPPPTPTRTATSTAIAGTTITTAALPQQYALAETLVAVPTPGNFNSFETSTTPNPGSATGVIKTRIAGTAFSLDVVAISGGTQMTAFSNNVKVELLANNGTAGTGYGSDNCPAASSVLQTIASTMISNGRTTVSFTAVPNAYRDVRVRVSYPTVTPTVTVCSTDSFAIRPNAFANFSASDADWQSFGTARTLASSALVAVTHKAGRPFTVRSDAVNSAAAITTNYAGAPSANVTTCGVGAACTASLGALTLVTTHSTGQLTNNAAAYSEVGAFTLQFVDAGFAMVDTSDGSTATEREIRSSTITVGRFVPDHFAVTMNAPQFATACAAGGFTYTGQSFGYAVVPVITVTAENAANATTNFYTGSLFRITNASLTGKTYTPPAGTLDTNITGTDPVIAPTTAGAGTLTFSSGVSGTGFTYARSTPADPFNANIALAINVIDVDGVAAVTNPVTFGAGTGIAFSTGSAIRYGRISIKTAIGSELVDLPVAMTAEYYAGSTSGFVRNTADTCTTNVSLAFSGYTENLGVGETCVRDSGAPGASGAGCAAAAAAAQRFKEPPSDPLAPGNFNLRLAAPGAGNTGGVVIDGTVPDWLKFDWNSATGGDEYPSGQATFGLFGGEQRQIYTREIY